MESCGSSRGLLVFAAAFASWALCVMSETVAETTHGGLSQYGGTAEYGGTAAAVNVGNEARISHSATKGADVNAKHEVD